jgi:hypothetical protein
MLGGRKSSAAAAQPQQITCTTTTTTFFTIFIPSALDQPRVLGSSQGSVSAQEPVLCN